MSADASTGMTPDWRHSALCHWFASLFVNELTEAQLQAYQQGEGDAILGALAELPGLDGAVSRLRNAFNGLILIAHPRLELAADFASLFLLDGRSSAPPYASVYSNKGNTFFAEPQTRMQQRLADNEQAISDDFREPSDHLSVMLEYLGHQFEALTEETGQSSARPTLADIKAFVEAELLGWLPAFSDRCQQVSTVSDVYPALARLLLEFCQSLQALNDNPG